MLANDFFNDSVSYSGVICAVVSSKVEGEVTIMTCCASLRDGSLQPNQIFGLEAALGLEPHSAIAARHNCLAACDCPKSVWVCYGPM
jgi:hypothetical protein